MFDATQALNGETVDGFEDCNIGQVRPNRSECETINTAQSVNGMADSRRLANTCAAGHKCPLHAHDAPGGPSCVGCNELRGLAACRHLVRRVQKQARAPIVVGARAGFRFGGTERRLGTPIIPQDSGEVK